MSGSKLLIPWMLNCFNRSICCSRYPADDLDCRQQVTVDHDVDNGRYQDGYGCKEECHPNDRRPMIVVLPTSFGPRKMVNGENLISTGSSGLKLRILWMFNCCKTSSVPRPGTRHTDRLGFSDASCRINNQQISHVRIGGTSGSKLLIPWMLNCFNWSICCSRYAADDLDCRQQVTVDHDVDNGRYQDGYGCQVECHPNDRRPSWWLSNSKTGTAVIESERVRSDVKRRVHGTRESWARWFVLIAIRLIYWSMVTLSL